MTDLYQILQIKPNASEQEIKKAYYNLSKKYHPDKCSEPNSCQRFQEINSAYNILIDEKTRKNSRVLCCKTSKKMCKKRESSREGGREEGLALEHLSLIMV